MTRSYHSFDIWLRRNAASREAAEAERRHTLKFLLDWLDLHAAAFGIARVCIFGSITRPYAFGAHSDIDLAVTCDDARLLERFAGAVEQAVGRAIDTVALSECRFASAVIKEGIWWTRSA